MQTIFGSGILWGRQLTDANGNAISNPTPVKFGVLQDVSIDFSFDTKTLYGQNQFPVDAGRGKGKISGKAKSAQVNGALLNSIVFGLTPTSGSQTIDFNDLGATAIPATPYQITIAPPNTGVFAKDLGVRYAATGLNLTRVSATPATGQYSVNEATGVYTFSTADTTKTVQIDYQYTATVAGSNTTAGNNLQMGNAPTFSCDLSLTRNGKSAIITLYSCIASKFTIATKLDDFAIPEFDFEAFADASGRVYSTSFSE